VIGSSEASVTGFVADSVIAGGASLTLDQSGTLMTGALRTTQSVQHQGVTSLTGAGTVLDLSATDGGIFPHLIISTGTAVPTIYLPLPSVGVLGQEVYIKNKNTDASGLAINTGAGGTGVNDFIRDGQLVDDSALLLAPGAIVRLLLSSNVDGQGAWVES
jgi:hypothetical protein